MNTTVAAQRHDAQKTRPLHVADVVAALSVLAHALFGLPDEELKNLSKDVRLARLASGYIMIQYAARLGFPAGDARFIELMVEELRDEYVELPRKPDPRDPAPTDVRFDGFGVISEGDLGALDCAEDLLLALDAIATEISSRDAIATLVDRAHIPEDAALMALYVAACAKRALPDVAKHVIFGSGDEVVS